MNPSDQLALFFQLKGHLVEKVADSLFCCKWFYNLSEIRFGKHLIRCGCYLAMNFV